MKITLVQSRGIVNDPKVNFFKARMRISNVDSEIFVFPEMFCSGYISDPKVMRVDSLQTTIINDIAKLSDNKGCTVICGCPVSRDGKLYDTALVIDGKESASYCKIHLSKDGVFDETGVFEAGDRPMVIERQGLRIGLAVGHDLFMSDLVRFYAENDTDMIICICALLPEQIDRFLKVAQSNAIQYDIPVMICNMTGNDCGKELGGRSAYIDGDGEFLETCTAGSDVREIRIDVEALNARTAARSVPPRAEFASCDRVEIRNTEADPNGPFCPFSG